MTPDDPLKSILTPASILGGILQSVLVGAASAWLCGAGFLDGLAVAFVCTAVVIVQVASIFVILNSLGNRA